jgi:hypothetical protein
LEPENPLISASVIPEKRGSRQNSVDKVEIFRLHHFPSICPGPAFAQAGNGSLAIEIKEINVPGNQGPVALYRSEKNARTRAGLRHAC